MTVINPQLEVDNSRDGQITGDTVDKTSSSNPYRFWLNSNHDGTEMMDGKYPVQEDLNPSSGSDVNNTAISCTRDLEDYSRIWITKDQMINQWLQSGKFLLALEWKSIAAGSPKIRIFPAYEPDGGRQYLTDSNTANSQISTPYGTAVTDKNGLQAVTSAKFFFPTTFWSNQSYDPTTYFLFDAISEGDGQLVVSLYQPDATTKVVESAPLYLRLRDIKKMYERWTVDPAASEDSNGGVTPNAVARIAAARSPGGFQYDANSPEEQKYILFVHGWNMDPWEKDAFAETAYKRLWWQGYKGRFGAFQWPTTYGFTGGIQAATDGRNFDNGEFVAWQSATGLLNKLNDLNSLYPGQVYLLAHSMGNVVAGEALRMAGVDTPVNTYVAAQAAIPAHAYDANCSPSPHSFYWTDPLGVTHNMDSGTTNRYAEYPTDGAPPYFNGIQGAQTFVNFYNENDYALSMWIVDQDFKPDNGIAFPGYYYDPPSTTHPTGFYYIAGSQDYDLFFPADTYKIFAYADEARSFALGATAGVNIFNGQPLGSTVWPDDTFDQGAYKEHPWHSAEFLFSNIEQNKFWNILMIKFGITPNP